MLAVYSAPTRRRGPFGVAVAASVRNIFSANLTRILAEKAINQRELAAAIDVAPEIISHWKASRAFPQTRQLDNLIKALEIHPEELFLDPSRVHMTPSGDVDSALVEAIRQALKSSGYDVTITRRKQ